MPREHNYLLGQGERLAKPHALETSSRAKNPPYPFERARQRLIQPVRAAAAWAQQLPADACPDDRVVIEVTVHPRYLSKSSHPASLLKAIGGRPVGRRAVEISPEAWGTKKWPDAAVTDRLFVALERGRLTIWAEELPHWSERHAGGAELTQVEVLSPSYAEEKLVGDLPDHPYTAELVLHNAGDTRVFQQFVRFAQARGASVLTERQRATGWLTFVPVRITPQMAPTLAQFAFVRAIRSMPRMRSVTHSPARSYSFGATLPNVPVASQERAVIFDGGIPTNVIPALARWVTHIEPPGIGPADPDLLLHGLAVTSSFLFGPLEKGQAVRRPACHVDHVRVLDTGTGDDLEYYDVLDRITDHLDKANPPYKFACLSLGPARAVTDDEVTAWTAEIDSRLAYGQTLMAVAVGNDGELDAGLGLNRIQPPSDGVNTLSVGACDSRGKKWGRAPYSCIGPGRSPGIFKPDVVAFGGTMQHPFEVLGPNLACLGITGTSFAAPFALRSCASVASLVGSQLDPLTLRALAVHRAEPKAAKQHAHVGWGRVMEPERDMVTCEDCESVVVYQGDLPLGVNLRAALALPKTGLAGKVQITATLAIAPEVDPEHASTYTRGGLGITFRPDAGHYELNADGEVKDEPETLDFFNTGRFKNRMPEYRLRKEAHKWEPVLKVTRSFDAAQLSEPFFDIFYHRRTRGQPQESTMPLRYALIVTVRCEAVPDLYQQVLSTYASILAPLQVESETLLQV